MPLLQTQYDALKKQVEVMEMEVMEARLIRAAEINGEVDDDDAGGSVAQGAVLTPSSGLGPPILHHSYKAKQVSRTECESAHHCSGFSGTLPSCVPDCL